MRRLIAFVAVFGLLSLTITETTSGQKLKLPSLLPFKAQKQPVKPFRLTDQADAQIRLLPDRPMFGVFQQQNEATSWISPIANKSKQLWSNAGKALTELSASTRDAVGAAWQRLESSTWQPLIIQPWWSESGDSATETLPGSGRLGTTQAELRPLRPNYRMSRQVGDKPKHRF